MPILITTDKTPLVKPNRTLIALFTLVAAVIPVVFLAISWLNGELSFSWTSFLLDILVSIAITVPTSLAVLWVLEKLQVNFPWQKDPLKRGLYELVLTILMSSAVVITITALLFLAGIYPSLLDGLKQNLLICFIANYSIVGFVEGIFFFKNWQNMTLEAERAKRDRVVAQFETLKNQVNPHFLFNSLNTLSSLIDLNKEKSKAFLDKLAEVYRYILQHKDEEVVTFRTEFEFIQSFVHLLKERFDNKILFEHSVPERDLDKYLPPITIQILIENAIKHNVASRKEPLKIELSVSEHEIIVRNNITRKKEAESTGIGLANIKARYAYLSDQKVFVGNDGKTFEVRVPLLSLHEV